MRGQLELGEDEVLAFPTVTAIYSRSTNGGRHGRLLLPHALTANEWNLYAHKREVPLRYQRPNDRARTPLSDEIRLQLPYPVELVHVIHAADPLKVESHWHKRFAALRRNGEWFELGVEEVREFKRVGKM